MIRPLLITALLLVAPSAAAEGFTFALGGGIASAGVVPDGFTISPSVGYSLRLGEAFTASLTNVVNVTGLSYGNPGIVDNLLLSGGYATPSWRFELGSGPAFVWAILCGTVYDRNWKESVSCNRVVGFAAAAEAKVTWYEERSRFGVFASVASNYVPQGAVYDGLLVQATIGPVFRMSDSGK